MTERDDDRGELDDVTRIVARANESLDEVLRITGGAQPEPPAEADAPDEQTRIVERSGSAESPDEETRIVERPGPSPAEPLDEATRIVDRAPAPAESVAEGAQPASDAALTSSLGGSPASAARPGAAPEESLDEATRIVDRAPEPTGDASTGYDAGPASAWDEATRIVDRAPAPAESVAEGAQPASDATLTPSLGGSPAPAARPGAAPEESLDEATRIVDRAPAPADRADPVSRATGKETAAPSTGDANPGHSAATAPVDRADTRIEPDESTRLVTRPATRAERRAEDLRRANELEDSTRIVSRPQSAEERAARDLAARLAARAENPHNDGPVDDATQLAIHPPEPIVDPDPPARAILPTKTRVISNTQTATFEQTGDERWPTGGAPRIAPLPSPAGEGESDGSSTPRPRLIDGLPARLQAPRWERETELRVVDTAQLHREARAQRRRQAATVVTVIAVVVVGSAAGLAALLLTSF
ncbi:hypothetical protein [Microbacterium sediminis]|uniref:Uncharacterized protein n=1 Tax=Microbacterium sediminis TaxID=904291 RepID=A0A1B9NDM3_9MICO|nr:hypothetical protein [Microbacterium sediminis]OCG74702.1 hypothetical protein A7J15_03990 [Microbacterium sediminis]QBR74997.1 hypothetical protein E3O41_11720 [Microbacterium sediminis]